MYIVSSLYSQQKVYRPLKLTILYFSLNEMDQLFIKSSPFHQNY